MRLIASTARTAATCSSQGADSCQAPLANCLRGYRLYHEVGSLGFGAMVLILQC
jgi:hypothetical protein